MINIVKYKTRSTIKFAYDPNIVAMLRLVESKYWDNKNKVWTIPNSALDKIKEELTAKKYQYEYEEFQPEAQIMALSDGLMEFKFNAFIDNIEMLKQIKCNYDSNEKKWTCQQDDLEELIDILKEANIKHTIKRNEPKPVEIQDTIKITKKGRPK